MVFAQTASATFAGHNGRIYFVGQAFTWAPPDQIYSIAPDGTDLRQLTSFGGFHFADAVPSPDGTRLATTGYGGDYIDQVYLMNTDGSGFTQITHDTSATYFVTDWSADGTHLLALKTIRATDASEIVEIALDGSEQVIASGGTRADGGFADYGLPQSTPDGSIAYLSDQGNARFGYDIYERRVDGTTARVTYLGDVDTYDFSPDGARLVVDRDQGTAPASTRSGS